MARAVDLYILTSDGIEASIMTYGARVVSIKMPNRAGTMQNVVLGYSALDGYLADKKTYFGAIVGRYGNRIALREVFDRWEAVPGADEQQWELAAWRHGGV